MKNTLGAITKIKRLGHKLLVSAGYVDQLGRRRQPPKIVEGKLGVNLCYLVQLCMCEDWISILGVRM